MSTTNNFQLTLDTSAPSGTIALNEENTNSIVTCTLTYTGTSETDKYMKVWFSTTPYSTKAAAIADANYPAAWATFATSYEFSFVTNNYAEGLYYAYAVLSDDVANESDLLVATTTVKFDKTAPVITSFTLADAGKSGGTPVAGRTNELTLKATVLYNDQQSSVQSDVAKIIYEAGDSSTEFDKVEYSVTDTVKDEREISLKTGAVKGEKTIKCTVVDNAGNTSTAVTAQIYYDPEAADADILLFSDSAYSKGLATYLNETARTAGFYLELDITSTEPDVVGYKVWGDFSNTASGSAISKPSNYTTVTSDTDPVKVGQFFFVTNDGTKTVNAEIIDSAGNITTLDAVTRTLDVTAPTSCTLSTDKSLINGSESATVAYSGSDNAGGSGIDHFTVYNETTEANLVDSASTAGTVSVSSSNLAEGENKIICTLYDKAGNSLQSNEISITLSTSVASFSIEDINEWYNSTFDVKLHLTKAGTSAIDHYNVWTDLNSTSTTIPETAADIDYSGEYTTAPASQIGFNLSESPSNYVHACATDAAGNVIYASSVSFGYDITKPSIKSAAFDKEVYNSRTATVTVTAEADASTVKYARIVECTSEGVDGTVLADWYAYSEGCTKQVNFSSDGIKYVHVYVKDGAENISNPTLLSCEIDTTAPTATLSINGKKSPSCVSDVTLTIAYTDDEYGIAYYKVWGDIKDGASTEDAATWVDFTPESGKKSISLALQCTDNASSSESETKKFYAKVKDNAGHESVTAPEYVSFVYDTKAPVAGLITNPNYYRISVTQAYRENTTDYADQIHFSFAMVDDDGKAKTDNYSAYKVCAYLTKAQAEAAAETIATEAAIVNTSKRSSNLSGGTGSGTISVTINGSDYRDALVARGATQAEAEGAHYIVLYICDEAGNWSGAIVAA